MNEWEKGRKRGKIEGRKEVGNKSEIEEKENKKRKKVGA
jgi:hypothetical protein